jgi:hypothetical protein
MGWIILSVGLLVYLISIHKLRKRVGKKTFWLKIGIAIVILGLSLSSYLIYDFFNSEPYQTAVRYIRTDAALTEEVGRIKGLGLIPTGSIQTVTVNGSQADKAVFFLTVCGDKKYKDIEISLVNSGNGWTVTSVY